jgi:lysophospholipase L1-like esterase
MMAKKNMRWMLVGALVFAVAAMPAFTQVDTGSADFSKYVALGDSLTAGFSNGGLGSDQQLDSFPRLIHDAATGDTTGFQQPLVSEPGIPPQLALHGLFPTVITPRSGMGKPLNLSLPRPYDNLGVPGATVHDLLTTVTDNGGIHDLILRGLGTAVQQALVQQPTFVTLWIGNDDVLAAAVSGVAIDGVTLTPPAAFEADLRSVVGAIRASGADLAIGNLPDVTAIPYVTTIPPVVVDPTTNQPVLVNGAPVPLIGPNGPLSSNDHVLLSATSELARGIGIPTALGGTGLPLSDSSVLSAAETAKVKARADALNSIIDQVAQDAGAALVDVAGLYDEIVQHGRVVGGIEFTDDFLTGGIFGYDGVHPTRLGYGLVANAFIDGINQTFGAHIPPVDLYPLAFAPPRGVPSTSGVDLTAAGNGNRWTSFVFTPTAWHNLRISLGLDRLTVDRPVGPGESPTAPHRGRLPGKSPLLN